MKELATTPAYVIAIVGGVILWLATSIVSGRTEAWDSALYWVAAYPSALLLAGILGYLAPKKPWRWALTVMLVQAFVLAITASGFGLLPLGLIVFAFLALPLIAVSHMAAGIRNRRSRL